MTWTKVCLQEASIEEHEVAKVNALGMLLGTLDAILAMEKTGHAPIAVDFETLRRYRDAYVAASKALLEARLGVIFK